MHAEAAAVHNEHVVAAHAFGAAEAACNVVVCLAGVCRGCASAAREIAATRQAACAATHPTVRSGAPRSAYARGHRFAHSGKRQPGQLTRDAAAPRPRKPLPAGPTRSLMAVGVQPAVSCLVRWVPLKRAGRG
jgi:hypothetical protein